MRVLHVRLTEAELKLLEETRFDVEHGLRRRLTWREFLVHLAQERHRDRKA